MFEHVTVFLIVRTMAVIFTILAVYVIDQCVWVGKIS